ncbi:MAG: response regulator, partial [Nitrospinae bacterium]|nr:response regulator [Nitrospinota bacterium]
MLSAENGKRGLEVLANNTSDCIFCDLLMPEMDGLTAFGKWSEMPETQSIPVIALTA